MVVEKVTSKIIHRTVTLILYVLQEGPINQAGLTYVELRKTNNPGAVNRSGV